VKKRYIELRTSSRKSEIHLLLARNLSYRHNGEEEVPDKMNDLEGYRQIVSTLFGPLGENGGNSEQKNPSEGKNQRENQGVPKRDLSA